MLNRFCIFFIFFLTFFPNQLVLKTATPGLLALRFVMSALDYKEQFVVNGSGSAFTVKSKENKIFVVTATHLVADFIRSGQLHNVHLLATVRAK